MATADDDDDEEEWPPVDITDDDEDAMTQTMRPCSLDELLLRVS
jgi:hypothetical protein